MKHHLVSILKQAYDTYLKKMVFGIFLMKTANKSLKEKSI